MRALPIAISMLAVHAPLPAAAGSEAPPPEPAGASRSAGAGAARPDPRPDLSVKDLPETPLSLALAEDPELADRARRAGALERRGRSLKPWGLVIGTVGLAGSLVAKKDSGPRIGLQLVGLAGVVTYFKGSALAEAGAEQAEAIAQEWRGAHPGRLLAPLASPPSAPPPPDVTGRVATSESLSPEAAPRAPVEGSAAAQETRQAAVAPEPPVLGPLAKRWYEPPVPPVKEDRLALALGDDPFLAAHARHCTVSRRRGGTLLAVGALLVPFGVVGMATAVNPLGGESHGSDPLPVAGAAVFGAGVISIAVGVASRVGGAAECRATVDRWNEEHPERWLAY